MTDEDYQSPQTPDDKFDKFEEGPVDATEPVAMTEDEIEEARDADDEAAEAQAEEDAQDEFDNEDEVNASPDSPPPNDDYWAQPENQRETEAPLEAASESDEDLIAQAVGMSYADFTKRHYMTARVLTARMGNPVEFLTETLIQDEDYKALIYATESDIDASRIAKVVVRISLAVAERVIIGL